MMEPPSALSQLTAIELAPPQTIRAAAATGCQAAGIRMIPVMPGGAAYPLMDDKVLRQETLRAIAETGIGISDVEIVLLTPDTDLPSFLPFLDAGARIGAKHVLVADYDPEENRFAASYAAFCDAAAQFGLTADLEFTP